MTAPNPAPGEPVTNAEQFDPAVAALAEASGDPEAFRLVYSMLMRRYDDSCRVGHMTQFADEVAAAAVQTLRDAGRLVSPDADTRPAGRCTAPVGAHQHSEACRVPVPTTPTEV